MRAEADFVSIHRNAAAEPGTGSGTMTLVYKEGLAARAGAVHQQELPEPAFTDLGTFEGRQGWSCFRQNPDAGSAC